MTKYNCVDALCRAGIAHDDAIALRRIAMTLHRWHELECGDGNDHGSWTIARGKLASVRVKTEQGLNVRQDTFTHDDDGKPYLEHHHHLHGRGTDYITYTKIGDRERGALKRLAAIMARYPTFTSYVQGDPRGASLYIMRPGDIRDGATVDSCYSNGVAVCQ